MTDDEIVALIAEEMQKVLLEKKGISIPVEEIVAQLMADDGPELSDADVSAAYRRLMASLRS